MTADPAVEIWASGGIVLRGRSPHAEVLLVHRPRYDDWTLPKGKADPGESPVETALREVEEETALACHVTGRAGTSEYEVSAGRKQVEYFTMRAARDFGFAPNEEVDAVAWVPVDDAVGRLTYAFDRELVTAVDLEVATRPSIVHLVRHGAAGDRSKWSGPDEERPLTTKGERQAEGLAAQLASIGVERILSSPYVRCRQSVEPLAGLTGIDVESHPGLAESAGRAEVAGVLEEVAGVSAVLSSHGDVIPAMLERLRWQGVLFESEYACKKGSTWSVVHDGGAYISARYWDPPPS
jgi:8-oxo-(d)GTP phosphatase